jgi:hypothetical protein
MQAMPKRSDEVALLSEVELPREEFNAIKKRQKELVQTIERIQLAQNLASVPNIPSRAAIAVEQAGEELDNARRNPRRTAARLEDLCDELVKTRPDYETAKLRYEAACHAESSKLADLMRPRHLTAVQAIADALQNLSTALAEEIAVREDFDRVSPTSGPTSYLPNMSADLMRFGWLPNRDSGASCWGREARAKGLLK